MARVNVDSQALIDARFGVLAGLMGSDDSDLALGRMIRVWMQCLERETYVITKPVIVALFRGAVDAPDWLVRAELAEEVDGGLRIKGTQGRIEYLAEKRATARLNGVKGGRPRKPILVPTSVSGTNPRRGMSETPPAPAPAPALTSSPSEKKCVTPTFRPPTLDEVSDYCKERGNQVDAQKFVDFYASKGWLVGKVKMKDWRAAVRTWEKNDYSKSNGKPSIHDTIAAAKARLGGSL